MSNEPTFSDLLDQARGGDGEARQRLFDQLAGADEEARTMLAIARRVLPQGDPARDFVESRDLIQSALQAGWLDLSRFQGESPGQFFSWLRTILRHKLGRKVRKRQPRVGGVEATEPEDPTRPEPEAHPLEAAVRGEMVERLREAIDSLPEDMRIVVERRLQGRNAPQIAEELDLSPAAVRKRESRAMARLREIAESDLAE